MAVVEMVGALLMDHVNKIAIAISASLLLAFSPSVKHSQKYFEKFSEIVFDVDEGDAKLTVTDKDHSFIEYNLENSSCKSDVFIDGAVLKIKNDKKNGGCKASYTFALANKNTKLKFQLGAGNIQTSGLTSLQNIQLGAGTIDIADFTGDIDVSAGAASVKLSTKYVPGTPSYLKVNLGSGALEVKLPDAWLKLKSNNYSDLILNKFKTSDDNYNFLLDFNLGDGTVSVSKLINN